MERRYEYQLNKSQLVIDSLNDYIEKHTYSVDTNIRNLNDTIHSLRRENVVLKNVIKDIQKDKEHYRIVNSNVIKIMQRKNDTIR
jgi:hypothetical protein